MFARKRANRYSLEGIQETHDVRHTCKHSPIWVHICTCIELIIAEITEPC